eukprot:gene2816-4224_t
MDNETTEEDKDEKEPTGVELKEIDLNEIHEENFFSQEERKQEDEPHKTLEKKDSQKITREGTNAFIYESTLLIFNDPLYLKAESKKEKFFFLSILFLKQIFAAIGGVIFWVGGWNALDLYLLPQNVYAEICCVVFGTILFLSLVFICEFPFFKKILLIKQGWKGWSFRTIRDILSACLAVVIWKGTYNIFDYYLLTVHIWWRSIVYLVGGLIILIVVGSLEANTSV